MGCVFGGGGVEMSPYPANASISKNLLSSFERKMLADDEEHQPLAIGLLSESDDQIKYGISDL